MAASTGHIFNLQPSPFDHRDYKLEAPIDYGVLPTTAMLPMTPPVRDQGQEGSCWGFSGSSAHAISRKILGLEDAMLSPAFLYWKTREAMGDDSVDGGSDLRTGMDTLLKYGNCTEDHMPYTAGDFTTPPLPAALLDAETRKITVYHNLDTLNAIKFAITQAYPVVFGIPVFEGFETTKDGHVPMPSPGQNSLGGHAILCVGYADSDDYAGGGVLILQNSWGSNAGDHGRYFIPYAYRELGWFEAWSVVG